MKKLIVTALLTTCCLVVFAQDQNIKDIQSVGDREIKDDTSHHKGWRFGGYVNINLAQGGTKNWAAGGEQFSLSANGLLNLFANYKSGKSTWYNSLDMQYSLVNTSSQGVRKNDDRFEYYSKYTYTFSKDGKWSAAAVGNFRTQFTKGYDYSVKPFKLISDFMAPAYITLSPGIDYKPVSYFSVFLSPVAARWVVVANRPFELAPNYAVDPYQKVKIELGAYLSANFKKELFKNVVLKSRLDLYSNYLKDPQNIDVYWTNIIALKVNNWLTVTYSLDVIYDDDIRIFGPNQDAARTQFKSLLGVGFATRF